MRFVKINKKILATLAILAVFFVGGLLAIVVYDTQSKVAIVAHYKPSIALKILDRKDRLIANVFDGEFRYYAPFDEIPPKIIETLLAVEDTMFFEHKGVNFDAISRAMIKNIKSGGYVEGGSTITQQLVKNLALSREKTIDRKLKEAVLALQVEAVLSKEEILEKYLNYIYFGHGYHGIKTAAHGYFNKDLSTLSLKEIAMLMALPRAPSYYDPVKNLELSISRANNILERMLTLGWITKDEYESASSERPIVYNQTLTQNLAPYVVDEVLRQLGHIKDLKTGGYVVRLHIDLDYQKAAQDALIFGYKNIKERLEARKARENARLNAPESGENPADSANELDTLNGAIVVTQSKSGNILALVGGVDYEKSKFNRATQAKRQFGSTAKPFFYQIAFDMGYSSASVIPDVARSFREAQDDPESDEEKFYRPDNYTRRFDGFVTLKDALRRSLNLATINLVDLVGFQNMYNKMTDYGFENLQKDMSIILGSFVLSPLEAAKYYSLFANYGTINEPKFIRSVLNGAGEEVFAKIPPNAQDSTPDSTQSADLTASVAQDTSADNPAPYAYLDNPNASTSPAQAYIMIDILKSVVMRGTGYRASVGGIELAGKTGTSNDNVDAWFSGFSPSLQVVVWYGRDDNTSIGTSETGGVIAAPAFAEFFRTILSVEPGLKRVFDKPKGVWKQNLNGEDYYYTEISKIPKQDLRENLNSPFIF